MVIDGRINELNRRAFLTIKCHKPKNLLFKQIPKKGKKIVDPIKKERLEEYNKMKEGRIIDTLPSIDGIEIINSGGIVLQVYDGSFVTI